MYCTIQGSDIIYSDSKELLEEFYDNVHEVTDELINTHKAFKMKAKEYRK